MSPAFKSWRSDLVGWSVVGQVLPVRTQGGRWPRARHYIEKIKYIHSTAAVSVLKFAFFLLSFWISHQNMDRKTKLKSVEMISVRLYEPVTHLKLNIFWIRCFFHISVAQYLNITKNHMHKSLCTPSPLRGSWSQVTVSHSSCTEQVVPVFWKWSVLYATRLKCSQRYFKQDSTLSLRWTMSAKQQKKWLGKQKVNSQINQEYSGLCRKCLNYRYYRPSLCHTPLTRNTWNGELKYPLILTIIKWHICIFSLMVCSYSERTISWRESGQ